MKGKICKLERKLEKKVKKKVIERYKGWNKKRAGESQWNERQLARAGAY